jgi:SlyX protein
MRQHSGMDTLQALEQRITDLEIKASFAEDTVEQLNQVVVRQQAQIDRLVKELVELRNQAAAAGEPGGFRSLRDELPPHY